MLTQFGWTRRTGEVAADSSCSLPVPLSLSPAMLVPLCAPFLSLRRPPPDVRVEDSHPLLCQTKAHIFSLLLFGRRLRLLFPSHLRLRHAASLRGHPSCPRVPLPLPPPPPSPPWLAFRRVFRPRPHRDEVAPLRRHHGGRPRGVPRPLP